MEKETSSAKLFSTAVEMIMLDAHEKILQAYIASLDKMQEELRVTREDNSFTVEDILKREG